MCVCVYGKNYITERQPELRNSLVSLPNPALYSLPWLIDEDVQVLACGLDRSGCSKTRNASVQEYIGIRVRSWLKRLCPRTVCNSCCFEKSFGHTWLMVGAIVSLNSLFRHLLPGKTWERSGIRGLGGLDRQYLQWDRFSLRMPP